MPIGCHLADAREVRETGVRVMAVRNKSIRGTFTVDKPFTGLLKTIAKRRADACDAAFGSIG
jgi:hypothetical protein